MIDFSKFNSIVSVINNFNNEDVCKNALTEARWGDDVVCPHCGKHYCNKRKDGRYRCNDCKHNFSCTVGTIFENSKLPLKKWFIAMYLISSHKKGVSSHQIARDCEITQKTAWYIMQKIRTLFGQDDSIGLDGDVEIDEMYLGGRETNKHECKKTEGTQGRSTKTKTPIFGMVQRNGGHVIAIKVDDTKAKTLMPLIKQFVKDNAHVITDELVSYQGLTKEGYLHDVIQHGLKMYSDGKGITTNSIEGFWAHFKRMVFGMYHFVSKKYLQRYIDEAVYRWNTRKADESARFADMIHLSIGIVSYQDVRLVG
jgi:transposase-like protein